MEFTSQLAAQQNVTANTYNAFNLTSVMPTFLGALMIVCILYVIFVDRSILSKLIVGYLFLGCIYVLWFIGYVLVKSFIPLRNTGLEILHWLGLQVMTYWWIIPTIPLAYYCGHKIHQKVDVWKVLITPIDVSHKQK